MSREKHGRYDEQSGLPDNTGQPVGDGSHVWLIETVEQHWPDLAALARQQRNNRYSWLIKELRALNDDQATEIAEEYRRKVRAAERDRTQRDRRRLLARHEEMLPTLTGKPREYIEKRIAVLRRQIDKAEH